MENELSNIGRLEAVLPSEAFVSVCLEFGYDLTEVSYGVIMDILSELSYNVGTGEFHNVIRKGKELFLDMPYTAARRLRDVYELAQQDISEENKDNGCRNDAVDMIDCFLIEKITFNFFL